MRLLLYVNQNVKKYTVTEVTTLISHQLLVKISLEFR